MADSLVLSIDGMGGDAAPDIVVEGIEIAARDRSDAHYLLHGAQARLRALLERHPGAKAVSEIVPAEKAIGMEVKPSQAMRQGKGSSLWNAVAAVETGQAHAVVAVLRPGLALEQKRRNGGDRKHLRGVVFSHHVPESRDAEPAHGDHGAARAERGQKLKSRVGIVEGQAA